MQIYGFQKTTLLDYPGCIAAVIFTGSCNFRCPFCQNSSLVLHPENEALIPSEDVIRFLMKRKGILDGVCISGGEPTLQSDLPSFAARIKSLGYKLKLDTNGFRPDVLISLCERKLVDYVAMDIKSSKNNYSKATGISNIDIAPIEASAEYLMSHTVPYEFRTTIVKELHTASDFSDIGKWLCDCRAYYLQSFKSSEFVMTEGLSAYSTEELKGFLDIVRKWIPSAALRGVD